MFRFSGLLVAVALVLVAQEAQAQDTSQHIVGGGRAMKDGDLNDLWSMSVAADVETDGTASGHLRLRSGGDGVYDIAINGGEHLGEVVRLSGVGADGNLYYVYLIGNYIALADSDFSYVATFDLVKGHIAL